MTAIAANAVVGTAAGCKFVVHGTKLPVLTHSSCIASSLTRIVAATAALEL